VTDDQRLIEDYLPIEKISAEASREKSVRKGHISTLHLWWARRPLVACRAAVYGALVPTSRFVPNGVSDEKKRSLGRANAAKFVERLCQYPGNPAVIAEARRHILEAHAARLSKETGQTVTIDDILEGRAPRPKVLDMFAGGGAIPLEALRLGCEAYALELNPVAHVIELCTLVYPQKYGKPDSTARGMAGPKNAKGETVWGGLVEEIRYWGNWVLKRVKAEIGDLYPLIADPEFNGEKPAVQTNWFKENATENMPLGILTPVAYLWTRTVTCKNPSCRANVPLVKQTWLCKKKGRYVALKITAPQGKKQVRFEVIEACTEGELGFDPAVGSKGGNATCPFCGTVADDEYVQKAGCAKQIGQQLMAVACIRPNVTGKVYLAGEKIDRLAPDIQEIEKRTMALLIRSEMTPLSEPLNPVRPSPNARGLSAVTRHGLTTFGDLFTPRQMLCLLQFASVIRDAEAQMRIEAYDSEQAKAVTTFLAAILDRLSDFNSSHCVFNYTGGRGVKNTFGRHALPMVWDFAETNPFNPEGASWVSGIEDLPSGLRDANMDEPATVRRGSATSLPWPDKSLDAVITDPPYYDNIPYADVSDFFYVWLKRVIGHLYADHFATQLTPKKAEATALSSRHGGNMSKANAEYESVMNTSFLEANRVLKRGGQLSVVYAHKTTLGWATLVDALRKAGFLVTEAWPLDTEKSGRLLAQDASALASSIFLVARKRDTAAIGNYEEQVRPELEQIVRERVATLWELGISGADLVIASVGAGLRAFTRFARVEYSNGEEVPAERFLTEVETVVLETILARLSKEVRGNGGKYSLEGLDPATRFYVLWRYTYKASDLDAGEAIIFANGTHIELDGVHGLSSGARALVAKNKSRYRLLDYIERGDDPTLGKLSEEGQPAPLVDALHRLLWLMERHPAGLGEFFRQAQLNTDQLRLVAQALAGPALKGSELGEVAKGTELAALTKLTANWGSVVEDAAQAAIGSLFRAGPQTSNA
jgi:putative DNA methylase